MRLRGRRPCLSGAVWRGLTLLGLAPGKLCVGADDQMACSRRKGGEDFRKSAGISATFRARSAGIARFQRVCEDDLHNRSENVGKIGDPFSLTNQRVTRPPSILEKNVEMNVAPKPLTNQWVTSDPYILGVFSRTLCTALWYRALYTKYNRNNSVNYLIQFTYFSVFTTFQ